MIEGALNRDGPWDEIFVQEPPQVGTSRVDISGYDYPFFRLVELETTGRRLIQGVSSSGRSERSADVGQTTKTESYPQTEALRAHVAALKERFKGKKAGLMPRTSGEASHLSIYTRLSLYGATQFSIGDFWSSTGCAVVIHSVDGLPQDAEGFRAALKSNIAEDVSAGADFILFVGDANDYREFSQPWPGDWEEIRQDRIAAGYPPIGQPSNDFITTFTIPDELPQHVGMSFYSPYYFTDQPYGDVDDDGIMDVVIARLPFTAEAEVYAYGAKLWSDPTWNADNIAFLVGDRAQGEEEAAEEARQGAGRLMQEIPPWTEIGTLYWMQTYMAHPYYNDVTADFINTQEPDLLVMVSSFSNRSIPGDFMNKTMEPPYKWTMSRIATPNVFFVIAASCGTADFARTENPAYGLPVAHEMLAEPGKGAIAWIGPTAGSWQDANEVVARYLLEELYRLPFRPAGEAFLRAIRRVLTDYSPYSDVAKTARSYVFLGDPLVPFSSIPSSSILSYVRRRGGGDPLAMPDNAAVGCPQGDEDEILIKVVIAGDELPMPLPPEDIAIEEPTSGNAKIFSPQTSSMIQHPNGDYEATISIPSFSGCGRDSALVTLYGMGIGYAQVNVKSPDTDALGTSDGKVNLIDFSNFGQHYRSSKCDCYYAYPYSWCVDYVPPADTTVDLQDFSFFGGHYNHHSSTWPPPQVAEQRLYSEGTVLLDLVEDNPLLGPRKLKAHVVLSNMEPYRIVVLSFKSTNPGFAYVAWHPDADYPYKTICAPVTRDGQSEVFLGILGGPLNPDGAIPIGYFELDINEDDEILLKDEDFALVVGDLLEMNGSARLFQEAVGPGGSMGFQKSYTPPVYSNTLAQNYPNPFNPVTTIRISLENSVQTLLAVYNVKGALVRTLMNERRNEGNHRIQWDGRDNEGRSVASGVYFYRIVAGEFVASRKMVLLR